MATAFFAHAPGDHELARHLAEFLEFGCNLICYIEEGLIGEGQDLISKAEEGYCADVVVLFLSPESCPTRWLRQRWEPALFDRATESRVDVVTVLLRDCSFPLLLRRRNFIDASENWSTARRLLKRWFWLRERESGGPLRLGFSADLEHLYLALADRASVLYSSGGSVMRFAKEAADEFEAVLWVPCSGRSLAQAAGELGHQLGLALDGPVMENCSCIREVLATHRCMVVLDAPSAEISRQLIAGGRTSTAVTSEAVRTLETPENPVYARSLLASRRYAEAYELLYRLLDAGIDTDRCARELTWICEDWGRVEEANGLRLAHGPVGMEQLSLF